MFSWSKPIESQSDKYLDIVETVVEVYVEVYLCRLLRSWL